MLSCTRTSKLATLAMRADGMSIDEINAAVRTGRFADLGLLGPPSAVKEVLLQQRAKEKKKTESISKTPA